MDMVAHKCSTIIGLSLNIEGSQDTVQVPNERTILSL